MGCGNILNIKDLEHPNAKHCEKVKKNASKKTTISYFYVYG